MRWKHHAVTLGSGVLIDRTARVLGPRSLTIGARTHIEHGVLLDTHRGSISIGQDCSINAYAVLYGHGGLTVGDHVLIGAHVVVIPSQHAHDRLDVPIAAQGNVSKGIVIENDVWVGAHAVVLDGVRIGEGAIIGAGAVVTRDIDPYTIAAGVPAKRLRVRRGGDEHRRARSPRTGPPPTRAA